MGAGGFGVLGWRMGRVVSEFSTGQERLLWSWGLLLAGLPLGALVAPYLTLKPMHRTIDYINSIPGPTLVAGILGLLVGLIVASLIAIPLYTLSGWFGWVLPFIVTFTLGMTGLWLGVQRGRDMRAIFPALESRRTQETPQFGRNGSILVDTSAIIDGRIADLSITGFLEGSLVVPRFILDELRHIADSSDPLRRNRGRRGLEILKKIQQNPELDIRIVDTDFSRVREVDSKLVLLAKETGGKVMTNDFNLNKVAELQGVSVLNINELANAVKPVVLPGEIMSVLVLKEGKEFGQGVGYLDDGTMVVVDQARDHIGDKVSVSVTSVLQTTAGRMIFTKIKDDSESNRNGA